MLLRDLVTRLTFKVDSEPLRNMDKQIQSMTGGFKRLAAIAVSGLSIQAGGSIELLREQFKSLWGEGVKPFRDEMEKLQSETKGLFTPRELLQAGISAKQAGLDGLEAAKALQLSSRIFVRATGGDLGQAMNMLIQGLQEGGLSKVFRASGLMSKQMEEVINFYESRIAEAGAGTPIGKRLVREFNRDLMGALQSPGNKRQLDKAFADFLRSPAAEVKRSQALLKSGWDELSSTIVKALAPALRELNDVLKSLNESVSAFGGIGGVITDVIGSIGALFTGEISPQSLKGLTYGGILMYLRTRNPIWLGAAAVGGGAGLITGGVESASQFFAGRQKQRIEEQARVFKGTAALPRGPTELRAAPPEFSLVEYIKTLFDEETPLTREPLTREPLSQPAGQFNVGGININISGVEQNVGEVADQVWSKLADEFRSLGNDQINNIEEAQ